MNQENTLETFLYLSTEDTYKPIAFKPAAMPATVTDFFNAVSQVAHAYGTERIFIPNYFSYIRASSAQPTSRIRQLYQFSAENQSNELLAALDKAGFLCGTFNSNTGHVDYYCVSYAGGLPDLLVMFSVDSEGADPLVVRAHGGASSLHGLSTYLAGCSLPMPVKITQATGIDTYLNVVRQTHSVSNEDIKPTHAVFYPWLEVPVEGFYNDFMASRANCCVLIGAPGTGKSNFLLNVARFAKDKTLICSVQSLMETTELYQHFIAGDYTLMILEDADRAIDANAASDKAISFILNILDGIIPTKKKIFISTNLSNLSRVNTALLRPGRCYDVLSFRKLTVPEAAAVRVSLQLPVIDLSGKTEWTLAEAINHKSFGDTARRSQSKIGFTN